MDIGNKTINEYEKIISGKTIFFNGPGVFEEKLSELGTKSLLTAIASSNAFSAVGVVTPSQL